MECAALASRLPRNLWRLLPLGGLSLLRLRKIMEGTNLMTLSGRRLPLLRASLLVVWLTLMATIRASAAQIIGYWESYGQFRLSKVSPNYDVIAVASGGGYLAPANVLQAAQYIGSHISYAVRNYTLSSGAGYPSFAGVMCFDINYDQANHLALSKKLISYLRSIGNQAQIMAGRPAKTPLAYESSKRN
jgi:hypothetical protein